MGDRRAIACPASTACRVRRHRDEYLDWLTTFWDAIDATGAAAVPGGRAPRVGGMIAAELAALRPEVVTGLALLAPFGIADGDTPGLQPVRHAAQPNGWLTCSPRMCPRRSPTVSRTSARRKRRSRATSATSPPPTSCGRSVIAALPSGCIASPHRGSTLWGDLDEVNPVTNAAAWGGADIVAGAGHLLEWDAPEQVSAALLGFLSSLGR